MKIFAWLMTNNKALQKSSSALNPILTCQPMTSLLVKRRGIAPAITTLILIGVAVAAGLGGYSAYNSASNVASLKGVVSVENVQLIKSSNGEEYLSITLKNSGNKQIAATTINLQTDVDANTAGVQPFSTSPLPAAMNPGQTSSAYSRINFANGTAITLHNIGDHIPVEIVSTTSDGSTVRTTASVTVSLS
ncbi:MAG TPA: hypothetical protein VNK44_02450 [Candidatus Nitrosotenuis sp.]|nr:hypothetical protein [Candidatus Nitrosotenuis sp.]